MYTSNWSGWPKHFFQNSSKILPGNRREPKTRSIRTFFCLLFFFESSALFTSLTSVTMMSKFLVLLLFFGLLSSSVASEAQCAENQFKCNNGKCILQQWICDGARDCDDGTDEAHEACDKHQNKNSPCFGNQPECQKHGEMRCIPHEWLCDGHPDCDKGEDELNCVSVKWFRPPESLLDNYYHRFSTFTTKKPDEYCQYGEYRCETNECIKRDKVCDGKNDCKDGSDETICNITTTTTTTVSSVTHNNLLLSNTTNITKAAASTNSTQQNVTFSRSTPSSSSSSSSFSSFSSSSSPSTTWSTTTSSRTTSKLFSTSLSTISFTTVTNRATSTTSRALSTRTTTQTPSTTTTRSTTSKVMDTTPITSKPPTLFVQPITTSTRKPSFVVKTFSRINSTPSSVSNNTTMVSSVATTKKIIAPHLMKAVQPTMSPTTTVLPFTPIMALLFVTAPPGQQNLTRLTAFQQYDSNKRSNSELISRLLRESPTFSNEETNEWKPVKYFKGIPIEPVNNSSSSVEEE